MATENNHGLSASVLAILRSIPKICGPVGYLKWKREVFEVLKWNSLWKYIEAADGSAPRQPAGPEGNAEPSETYTKWWEGDDHTRTALRSCVEGGLYCDIVNCKTAEAAWGIIKKVCEPKGSAALMATFAKYKNLKCDDCESPYQYGAKFREIGNELAIYPGAPKMDPNWLIYQYLANLPQSAGQFIDRWIAEHEPFNNATKDGPKDDVTAVMHAYESQCANPIGSSAHNGTGVAPLATGLAAGVVKETADGPMVMVPKCDYTPCGRSGHWSKDCRVKYPHLKKQFEDRMEAQKNRRNTKKDKKKKEKEREEKEKKEKEAKEKGESYGAVGAYASHPAFAGAAFSKLAASPATASKPSAYGAFYLDSGSNYDFELSTNGLSPIAALSTTISAPDFIKAWLLDTGASYHMTGDRSVFISFTPLTNRTVGGIGGDLKAGGYGSVRLLCKGGRPLTIHNVLYVENCPYNLLSFSQLNADGCPLAIIKNGFSIGTNGIQALLRCGLYFVQMEEPVACVSVNPDTLRMWHERLGHLGNQNVIKLASSVGIDLSKPPPSDPCLPCGRGAGKTEPHKGHIAPGRHQADLIHGDLMGPFPVRGYNGARHVAVWQDDKTKQSHTDTLLSKEGPGVLASFRSFLNRIEHGENRCTRIRIDNGTEYLNEAFMDYTAERGIRLEPTTAGNPQMNGCAERLNQIIMRKANTFLKDNAIALKWWPELVNAANHLRNICPVTGLIDSNGKPITPFHASTGRPYNYSTLRRIGQRGEYQVTKPAGGYKKFDSHRAPGVLVGYEGEHIYRIITEQGKIKRCSNVEWYDNLTARPVEKDSPQRSSPSQPQPQPQPAHSPSSSANEIDRFLDDLAVHIDDERPKLTPFSRQSQAARNPMVVIPPVNNSNVYTTMSTPASGNTPTPAAGNTPTAASSASSPAPPLGSSPPAPSPNDGSPAPTPSTSGAATPASVDELASDPTLQGTRLPSTASSEANQLQHALNRHSELRPARDSSVDPLTGLAALPNCDPAVAKAALALLAKASPVDPYEPKTYKEAMADAQHKMDWQLGMDDEMASHRDNKTWILVDEAPKNRKVLTGKWVYKCKRGIHGEVTRYKARWCVRGFEQLEGLDYHETFASVVKPMSYKAIFAIAAANDWDIEQMDVKTAFLYGTVDEEIYVEVPDGYRDPNRPKVVCRLRKALYGLKQAPRVWSDTLGEFLKQHGFIPLNADQSVFCDGKTIIAIYVDDLLITGPNSKANKDIKAALSKRFQMTDLGPMAHYLGMRLDRDRQQRILWLSQQAYLEKILKDHGFMDSKPVQTPMETATKLEAAPAGYVAKPDFKHTYQSAVGSLMYAMLGTRPDIAFAVSVVSRYASNPTEEHWAAVKRIFRYLKGTLHLRLTFTGPLKPLAGYTDADWAGDKDTRRSTSGYVFNLGSGAITWSSKRQPTVALSTCEAEYIGQTQAAKEAIWLSGLLNELDTPDMPTNIGDALIAYGISEPAYSLAATIIYCDNQGAQALAKNPTNHSRMKHMDIQHHFVREKVAEGRIQLEHVPTQDQIADGLTKPLPRDAFEKFRSALGLT